MGMGIQKRITGYDAICLIIGIVLVLEIIQPVAGAMITCPSGYQCMLEGDAAARWGAGNYGKYSSDSCGKNEDGAPVLYCFAEKYVMSVTTVITACPQISCPAGQVLYCPRSDNCPGSCGLQCRAAITTATTVPLPQCSPPSCKPGETVICPGKCPNGCGLVCKPHELSCSLPVCGPGETVYCPGACPNGCGLVCRTETSPAGQQKPVPSDAALNTCRIISQGETVNIGDSCLNIFNAVGGESTISWYDPGMTPGSSPPRKIINVLPTQFNFVVAPEMFTGYTGMWYRGNTNQVAFIVTPAIHEFIQVNTVTPSENLAWGQTVTFTGSDTFRNDKNCYLNITGPGLPGSGVIFASPAIKPDGSWTYEWKPSSVPGYPDLGPGTYIVRIMNGAKTDFVKWKLVFVEGPAWQPARFAGQTPGPGIGFNMPFILTPTTWPGGGEPESSHWPLPTGDFFSTFGDLLVHGGTFGIPLGPKTTLDETLPPGYAICGYGKEDLRSDIGNCGKCGYNCEKILPPGEGKVDCDYGICVWEGHCIENSKEITVNLLTDKNHCGSCDNSCGTSFCAMGKCFSNICPDPIWGPGPNACVVYGNSICTDFQSDPHNCGYCGNECFGGTCVNGKCICTNGFTECFNKNESLFFEQLNILPRSCVDLAVDSVNCGSCNTPCFAENYLTTEDGHPQKVVSSCINGQCMLDCARDAYHDLLVDIFTDNNNCGKCGKVCHDNESCYNGNCIPAYQAAFYCEMKSVYNRYCDRKCVNVTSDPENCIYCGNVCPTGMACTHAGCMDLTWSTEHCGQVGKVCLPGEVCCGGVCTKLSSSALNCGMCGVHCADDETCNNGKCFNLVTDSNNCGTVGNACLLTERCCKGKCITIGDVCMGETGCPLPYTKCNGRCADTMNDANNCGSCGKVCNNHGCGCENGVCNKAEFSLSDKKWTCL